MLTGSLPGSCLASSLIEPRTTYGGMVYLGTYRHCPSFLPVAVINIVTKATWGRCVPSYTYIYIE